jgi:Domain of unknown function (DUF4880)
MSEIVKLRTRAEIDEEAAAWIWRMESGPGGSADPQGFEAWLRQDPRHRRAVEELTKVWGALDGLAESNHGESTAVNPNAYVASLGFWIVQRHIQSFTDDMRFSFDLFPGNTLTVGGYLAAYSSDDRWWLGNNELVTATPRGDPAAAL